MQFITDFADGAVVLPFIFLVWVVSALMGFRAVIQRWVIAVALVLISVMLAKTCWLLAATVVGTRPISPSGHTASACIVYGGLAWLGLRRIAPDVIAALASVAIAAAIGLTRVEVGAHTVPEVVMGAAIGLGGLACFMHLHRSEQRSEGAFRIWPVVLVALVVLPIMHGHRLPVERELRHGILGH